VLEKHTWKIVAGVYIPGNETLVEHCARTMGHQIYAERAVGGLHRVATGLSLKEIEKRGGDWLTFEEAQTRAITIHESIREVLFFGFSKCAVQFSIRNSDGKVVYLIGPI